jgi:protein-S-isoprenylcysteine O-methyltransferase Ste14
MYFFFVPLIVGFSCNLASAFTAAFSRRWGERRGTLISALLRDILGIPCWVFGFVLAIRLSSPTIFSSSKAIMAVGYFLIVSGSLLVVLALATIRRRAAQPSTRDVLAQSGLYAFMRHPIHSGTILEFTGLLLIKPTLAIAASCLLGLAWVLLQTSLEEIDLLQRLPQYRDYMNTVPRFLPIRKKK